jgi:hypothetical protein
LMIAAIAMVEVIARTAGTARIRRAATGRITETAEAARAGAVAAKIAVGLGAGSVEARAARTRAVRIAITTRAVAARYQKQQEKRE